MKDKKISAVVSVYNEELSLRHFYQVTSEILEKCAWDYEIVFVNDGSQDKSMEILTEFAQANEKVKVVNFARNFGHEAAMIAGIDHAGGDGIVCMDADLQHPPESIPAIIEKFEEGYEVISMIRTKNEGAGVIKKITSAAFYRVLNMMSPVKFENNSSDFFAISKNVAEVLRQRNQRRQVVGVEHACGSCQCRRYTEGQKLVFRNVDSHGLGCDAVITDGHDGAAGTGIDKVDDDK